MASKRFIVEIGTGIDLHGENATKAACRAVRDAVSRSCLCGIVEVLGIQDLNALDVEIVVAVPRPGECRPGPGYGRGPDRTQDSAGK